MSKKISVAVPDLLYNDLVAGAAKRGESVSSLCCRLILTHLDFKSPGYAERIADSVKRRGRPSSSKGKKSITKKQTVEHVAESKKEETTSTKRSLVDKAKLHREYQLYLDCDDDDLTDEEKNRKKQLEKLLGK